MGYLPLAELPRDLLSSPRELSVFDAVARVVREGGTVDPFVVRDAMGADAALVGPSDIEWCEYADGAALPGALPAILTELRRQARRRQVQAAGQALLDAADGDTDLGEAVADTIGQLADRVADRRGVPRTLAGFGDGLYADVSEGLRSRLTSPWRGLAEATGGLGSREIAIIGALPGFGKSAAAQQWGEHEARLGSPVLFLSFEMPGVMLAMRTVARNSSGLPLGRLLKGGTSVANEAAIVLARVSEPLFEVVDDIGTLADAELACESWARRTAGAERTRMVILDHMQHVAHDGDLSIQQQAQRTLEFCARMARRHSLGVLAIGQFTGDKEIGAKRPPTMSDLWGGAVTRHMANTIVLLHEPEPGDPKQPRDFQLRVAKARQGTPGTVVPLRFVGAHARFESVKAQDAIF